MTWEAVGVSSNRNPSCSIQKKADNQATKSGGREASAVGVQKGRRDTPHRLRRRQQRPWQRKEHKRRNGRKREGEGGRGVGSTMLMREGGETLAQRAATKDHKASGSKFTLSHSYSHTHCLSCPFSSLPFPSLPAVEVAAAWPVPLYSRCLHSPPPSSVFFRSSIVRRPLPLSRLVYSPFVMHHSFVPFPLATSYPPSWPRQICSVIVSARVPNPTGCICLDEFCFFFFVWWYLLMCCLLNCSI